MLHLDILEQESVTRKWIKLCVTNTAEQWFLASHACPLPFLGDVSVERLFHQGGSLQRESFRQRNQGLLMFVWSSREFIHEFGSLWMVNLNDFIFIWLHKNSCAALLTGSPWHWGTHHKEKMFSLEFWEQICGDGVEREVGREMLCCIPSL